MFAAGTNDARIGGRTNGDASGGAKAFTGTFTPFAATGGFTRSMDWLAPATWSHPDRGAARPERRGPRHHR
ncbi:hypothetical protein [Saliphagus sp. LR7]|uniref:hypothetical protein n=1 Tax=Saliphagus sp. LR7 TaxID=2282654 RepID=UPI000DF7C4A1|nr:hypothetical protein [Saliphagus sp. LR7]